MSERYLKSELDHALKEIATLKAENEKAKMLYTEAVKGRREFRAMYREARNALKGMMDAHEMTMREDCGLDEKHCTCVPFYREEIKNLKGEISLRDEDCFSPCQEFKDTCKDYANTVKERNALKARVQEELMTMAQNSVGKGMFDEECRVNDRYLTALKEINDIPDTALDGLGDAKHIATEAIREENKNV